MDALPKSVKWSGIIVWIIALLALLFSGPKFQFDNRFPFGNFSGKHGRWNIGWSDNNDQARTIDGNGVLGDRTDIIPAFDVIKLNEDLIANIQLEQNFSDTTQVLINGDSNLIDKIRWKVEDGELKFYVDDNYRLNPQSNLIIKVTAHNIKGVEIESIGSVTASRKLQALDFYVKMEGAGNFRADSLYCNNFDAKMGGLGNMEVAGKASTANLKLSGAGKIKAIDLEAKTVDASLQGVGKIACNPIESLNASVNGIGKISYKSEPVKKNIQLNGMGKVDKE